jgi:ArsR family transcriptional regulator
MFSGEYPLTADVYEEQADFYKALAHRARLQILDILSHGEACVCHLTAVLEQRQPYVSQHLMVLREAQLVHDRREGTVVYYRLADDRMADLLSLSRELLYAQGLQAGFPPVPEGIVSGCSCPKCMGELECV